MVSFGPPAMCYCGCIFYPHSPLVIMETQNVTDLYRATLKSHSMDIIEEKKASYTLTETHPWVYCTPLWSLSQLEIKGLPLWKMSVGFGKVLAFFFPLWFGKDRKRVNGNYSFKRFLSSFLISGMLILGYSGT